MTNLTELPEMRKNMLAGLYHHPVDGAEIVLIGGNDGNWANGGPSFYKSVQIYNIGSGEGSLEKNVRKLIREYLLLGCITFSGKWRRGKDFFYPLAIVKKLAQFGNTFILYGLKEQLEGYEVYIQRS